MAELRVLIRAGSHRARANYRELVSAAGLTPVVDPSLADVTLVDLTDGGSDAPLAETGPAVVLVSAETPAGRVAEARAAGASVLSDGVSREQLRLALEATARGLIVRDPPISSRLNLPRSAEPPSRPPADARGKLAGEPPPLTDREHDILRLLAEGLGNRDIASALGLSDHTVKFHLHSVFAKLGVRSRTEAVSVAVRRGLLLL